VRLLAKQLYQDELSEASSLTGTEAHLPQTPQRSESNAELKHTASPSSASDHLSMHSHFIDSQQLTAAQSIVDRSPARRSPSRRDETATLRRSPRLMAKQDNLLLISPAASTSSSVGPAYAFHLFTFDSGSLLGRDILCINGSNINHY